MKYDYYLKVKYVRPRTGDIYIEKIGPFSSNKRADEAMLLCLKKRNVISVNKILELQ